MAGRQRNLDTALQAFTKALNRPTL